MNEQGPQLNTRKLQGDQLPQPETSEQESPFYNVLPKTGLQGPVVKPKLEIATEAALPERQLISILTFVKTHKTVIAIVAIVLILAYPVYYVLDKYVLNPSYRENLLSEEALKQFQQGANKRSGQSQTPAYKTPADWQNKYFGSETCVNLEVCGDDADPDHDGLTNYDEYKRGTDPNNPDSDSDGLADGDEVNIFNSDPTNANTAGDTKYNDGQYIKGGYNPQAKDRKFDNQEIADISSKMKQFKLHQPTVTTLKDALLNLYHFSDADTQNLPQGQTTASSATSSVLEIFSGIDQSPEAKQDRDTQRSNTIKNIGIALIKYYGDKKAYPATSDFKQMFDAVKIYARVATNPVDPINKDKYVYTYAASGDGKDFVLTFFSESQNQIIRTRSADAQKYLQQEQAAILDDQRKNNLETIRTALLLYSNNNVAGNQEYVFPKKENYQKVLVPEFITEIPKDPKTNEPYEYQVSETFDSFTLKAALDAPPTGRTGYLCNQEECRYY